MTRRHLAIASLILLLAGCSEPESSDAREVADQTSTVPTTVATKEEAPDAGAGSNQPQSLLWSDCSGIYTTTVFPTATGPGGYPDGWDPPHHVSEIRIVGAECQRVSYGQYERGPVGVVIEFHNRMEPPVTCQSETGPMQYWMLSHLWLTDTEIVNAIVQTDMIPVEATKIPMATENGGLLHRTLTWSSNGGQSALEVYQDAESENYGSSWTAPARMYWENQYGGVSWSAFAIEGDYTGSVDRPVTGTLSPPMLQSGDPAYAGLGGMLERTTLGGEIHRFANHECTQPLS